MPFLKDPLARQSDRHTAAIGHFLDLADELGDVAEKLDEIADAAEHAATLATARAQLARGEAVVAANRATRFREFLG